MAGVGKVIVEKNGLLDTIQDLGRAGYQSFGMVVAGAMDPYAYHMGNLLLGNQRGASSLEITMIGPMLRFTALSRIVITGANLSPSINGQAIAMWRPIRIEKGDVLSFGARIEGCRSYVAIDGGFSVQPVMGSTSTYIKGGIGGLSGRAIQKGDEIPYQARESYNNKKKSSLHFDLIPRYPEEINVRVILGPQEDAFTEQGIQTFLTEWFIVTQEIDRMGIRLKGIPIEHKRSADIYSDAIPIGAIQIPANGQPIIMMADRQVTGGYTKIATVINVDLPKLAQVIPLQKIRFEAISIKEAQELYRQQLKLLQTLDLLNR